jgi:hypothetical protein
MNRRNFLKIVTALNVLVAAGFSIVGVAKPALIVASGHVNDPAAGVFALFAAARAVPLAILTMTAIFKRRDEQIGILAILAGCIQLADGCIGLHLHDLSKSAGPFTLATLQFLAVYLVRRPGHVSLPA